MEKQWKQCQTWGSKITADGDCSHEIKRHILLGSKVMTNLDSIFKSRDKILHEIQDVCQVNKEMQESMGEVLSQGKK